jgi:hypothetical protein
VFNSAANANAVFPKPFCIVTSISLAVSKAETVSVYPSTRKSNKIKQIYKKKPKIGTVSAGIFKISRLKEEYFRYSYLQQQA